MEIEIDLPSPNPFCYVTISQANGLASATLGKGKVKIDIPFSRGEAGIKFHGTLKDPEPTLFQKIDLDWSLRVKVVKQESGRYTMSVEKIESVAKGVTSGFFQ